MFGSIAVVAPLIAILVVSIWFAVHGWRAIEGPAMPLAGYVILAAGAIVTLILGVGLMSLLFYSRRHGYDDAAGRSEDEE
jgi:hypothetical protein